MFVAEGTPRVPKLPLRGLLSKYPSRANTAKVNNTKGSHRSPPPPLGCDNAGAGRSVKVVVSTLGRGSAAGVRSTKCSIWDGESRTSSISTVLAADGTALGPEPRMRDNPEGEAEEISSLWPESNSVSPREPEPCAAIRFPSTPKVKGVMRLINLLADAALTPPDFATTSVTEE